ncbi:MAG: hypothetical protein ACYC1D_14705 [Acidimicrobiales bacterium]
MRLAAGARMMVLATLVGAGAAACGGSSTNPAASTPVGCSTTGAAAQANSASYHYVLDVGPTQQMYSRAQVAASHPKHGEVMVSGSMAMASGPGAQHLEVHICSRTTGEVVVGAAPSITLTDTTAGTTTAVPVAAMQGVTAGQADLHYGNNVDAPAGHSFVVTVKFRGQQATLRFTRPS